MKIVVVGAGALGGVVGALLSESGQDVTLVETNRARQALLSENGLHISEVGKPERRIDVNVTTSLETTDPADLVFVAVKSYQTGPAVRASLPVIDSRSWVLSMQNGIGNTRVMAEIVDPNRILSGITYHSIQHVGPNRLRYRSGIKPIQIAPENGVISPELEAIGEVFRGAGFATEIVENIDNVIWQKLLHNAVVNPVSALTGLTCSELLEDEHMQDFLRALCMETVAVMRARGVPIIDEEDPYRPVIGSQRMLAKNRPSMWQDLVRGNLTEVDVINGAIVEEAKRLGLQAPHNESLVRFIHSRERQKILKKEEIDQSLETGRNNGPANGPTLQVNPVPAQTENGLPSGRVQLKSTARLKSMLRDYHQDLQEAAHDPNRRIAWSSAMGPVEIVRALGMTPYFPENHAALIGAGHRTQKYISRALAEGFSQFANSAMTSDIGAMLLNESPLVRVYGIDGPPKPDVLVYSTNFGHRVVRWFEYYAHRYQVPVHGLHSPVALRRIDVAAVGAGVQQILGLVGKLERATGTRLDIDRLAEVVGHSSRAAKLWGEIMNMAQVVPSPITYFDLLIHLAPMLLLRGTPEAVRYYEILKAELEERVAAEQAAVPGERFRFYWEGPPIWGALRSLSTLFLEHQAVIVASTYGQAFALEGLDPNNPVESLARTDLGTFPNRSDDYKASFLQSKFKDFAVDGVIFHDGRTNPEHSNVRYGLERRLRRETGIPSLILEADTHDRRLLSMNQIRRQLADFIEQQEYASAGTAE